MAVKLQIAGIRSLTLTSASGAFDAISFVVDDGAVRPGSRTRESLNGANGVAGYSETEVAPGMTASVYDHPDTALKAIAAADDIAAIAYLKNGKAYALSSAWLVNDPEIAFGDGKFDLELEGLRCEEVAVSS